MSSAYKTIARPTLAQLVVNNSKFIGYTFPIDDEDEANTRLDEIRQEHPKATHWCYALRIGTSGDLFRANDDGEPSGSAGRPILGQIDSFELTNVLIIVVRYYGGVNLGVSGLIKAYKESAQLALEQANIVVKHKQERIEATIPYAQVNFYQEWVNQQPVKQLNEEYTNTSGIYQLQMNQDLAKEIVAYLKTNFEAEVKSI